MRKNRTYSVRGMFYVSFPPFCDIIIQQLSDWVIKICYYVCLGWGMGMVANFIYQNNHFQTNPIPNQPIPNQPKLTQPIQSQPITNQPNTKPTITKPTNSKPTNTNTKGRFQLCTRAAPAHALHSNQMN